MNRNAVHVTPLQQVCYKVNTAGFMGDVLSFIKALTALMNNDMAEFSFITTT